MDPDSGVELGLGRAAIKRHGEPLDDLPGIWSDHMTAKYKVSSLVDNQFHHRSLVPPGEGVL
jgi:hypothetical protein